MNWSRSARVDYSTVVSALAGIKMSTSRKRMVNPDRGTRHLHSRDGGRFPLWTYKRYPSISVCMESLRFQWFGLILFRRRRQQVDHFTSPQPIRAHGHQRRHGPLDLVPRRIQITEKSKAVDTASTRGFVLLHMSRNMESLLQILLLVVWMPE